ncbi:MAG: quinone-dependent dihydroorotate dehydrogenase [Holosporales bacterium]|jgi:dihydroorotate dehydrogenase
MAHLGEIIGRNFLHLLPPELAHNLALIALKNGLVPRISVPERTINLWGKTLRHPLGLAAGFDKDGIALPGLIKMGFSAIEVGTTTPLPQLGNPKPRLFRIPGQRALINRLGFNNAGHDTLRQRLECLNPMLRARILLGVNIGKNKESPSAIADYTAGVRAFADLADYIVVNISSPNTPGLRALQDKAALEPLLETVSDTMARQPSPKPVCLKIAPDLSSEAIAKIAELAVTYRLGGLVISNTTITRPESLPRWAQQQIGGLSGVPLKPLALTALSAARAAAPTLPLIGVGGISSRKDLEERLAAGASFVQVYSAFVYQGAGVLRW